MSYSMSPPQKSAPHPYPPPAYPNSASPPNASPFAPPPAKRPRLSPDPRSPSSGANGAPMYANQPNGVGGYGNPYAPSAVQSPYSPSPYAASPQSSFNTPQPYTPQPSPWASQSQPPTPGVRPQQGSPPSAANNSAQMMPPPPRPNKEEKEERVGVEDIGDMLTGSGVNLKDEENYITGLWNNRQGVSDSFTTTQSTSFDSSTISPNPSFNYLTQGTSFQSPAAESAFAGTLGQSVSQEDVDAEMRRKRESAARALAEKRQHHLNNQFLLGNCLRRRMDARTYEGGVKVDVQGVYVRNVEPQTQTMVNGAGTDGVVSTKAESVIEPGVQYDHILSLVSLATGERLRGLINEAYGLARARQYGDHGRVVPPEFSDIADGEGKTSLESVVPEALSGSQWDAVAPANGEGETSGEKDTPQSLQTISFQGTMNARLRELAERDKQAEKDRIKRRQARKRKAEDAVPGDDTVAETAPDPATPAASGDPTAPSKLTKKEQNKKKQEAANSTEAQLFNQSNQTAAMMAMGKRGKQYSWMTGGVSNMPTNRFAKPAGASGTVTPKQESSAGALSTSALSTKEAERAPTWGDWREDSVDGRGIQLRDWVFVLERDGREKRALQKATLKLQ